VSKQVHEITPEFDPGSPHTTAKIAVHVDVLPIGGIQVWDEHGKGVKCEKECDGETLTLTFDSHYRGQTLVAVIV
jgi:hypothetical protein